MEKNLELKINRITEMESIFDQVLNALKGESELCNECSLQESVHKLIDYYENGQWLQDYEADERGELPADLKRGVLSQDGIYNILFEIKQRGGICDSSSVVMG